MSANCKTLIVALFSVLSLTSSFAANAQGSLFAWGSYGHGQLGNNLTGSFSTVAVSVDVSGALSGKVITAVAAGGGYGAHSLALDSTGHVYAWGYNGYGQLGNGATGDSSSPIAVSSSGELSGKSIVSISAGAFHTLALDSSGHVYAWGYNSNGQLGNVPPDGDPHPTPSAVFAGGALSGKTIIAISAGNFHSMALDSDGVVYAWGAFYGLGNGSSADTWIPAPVDTSGVLLGKRVIAISGGGNFSLALDSAGKVYSWGYNGIGELGDGTNNDALSPILVNSGALANKTITAISAGTRHSMALSSTGQVFAWGEGVWGAIGNNSTTGSLIPTAVDTSGAMNGKTIVAISSGGFHSLALDTTGKVYAWGDNEAGELGTDFNPNNLVPVAVDTSGVLSGVTITGIAAGGFHSLAVRTSAVLTAVSLSSSSVNGGTAVTGTVNLLNAVGVDTQINLTSTNSAASVPASVIVPANATSASFTINTVPVGTNAVGVIKATFGAVTKQATLTVKAATFSTFTLSPSSVQGGATVTGTVTFTGPVATDKVVALNTSMSAANLPASIIIHAGSSSATFAISTVPVIVSQVGLVLATSGITKSVTLTIKPPVLKSITLSPATVIGGMPVTGTVTLTGTFSVDTTVTLASTNAKAHVPPSVVVSAGTISATFTITTDPVIAAVSGSIQATNGIARSTLITVAPPVLSSLTLSTLNVIGGQQVTGTVLLSGPVAADTVVTLSSANSKAHVAASVVIASGTFIATFSVSTDPVVILTAGSISATLSTVVKSVTLTVKPPAYQSFTLTPSTVMGGSAVTGTVTLSGAAPVTTVVTLTNTNSKATLPGPTVTIPAGSSSVSFMMSTMATATTVSGTVKAAIGATAKSVTLKVTP